MVLVCGDKYRPRALGLGLGFRRYGCGMRIRHAAKNGYSVNA